MNDQDIIWEYPEDEWISMVRNGRTQPLKPLATYRVLEDPFTWAEHDGMAEEFLELS